jgi:hypothetical protein
MMGGMVTSPPANTNVIISRYTANQTSAQVIQASSSQQTKEG